MKHKPIAGALAMFLGTFGIHRFYLGQYWQGWGYLLLCWTLIPFFIGLLDGIWIMSMSDDDFDAYHNNVDHYARHRRVSLRQYFKAGLITNEEYALEVWKLESAAQ